MTSRHSVSGAARTETLAIVTALGAVQHTLGVTEFAAEPEAFTVGERWRMGSTSEAQGHIEAARARRAQQAERYRKARMTTREEMIGHEYGRLLVIDPGDTPHVVIAECSCGVVAHFRKRDVQTGHRDRCRSCLEAFVAHYGRTPKAFNDEQEREAQKAL